MTLENAEKNQMCPRAEIAEYIDGELSPPAELDLEMHFLGCEICARELNEQKTILNALDLALEQEKEISLPKDFTKVVVANAESRVNGLRRKSERLNALFIAAVLFLIVVLTLGSDTQILADTFRQSAEQIVVVGGFIGHIIYDFAIGLTVILKSLCFQFVFKSAVAFILPLIFLGVAALLFSRFITGYKRTGSEL